MIYLTRKRVATSRTEIVRCPAQAIALRADHNDGYQNSKTPRPVESKFKTILSYLSIYMCPSAFGIYKHSNVYFVFKH